MSKKFDYLIVGQGLAGTCLAFTLEHYYKQSVFIVDQHAGKHCSQIAAGTFNPLAFRTLTPTWRAEEFIPHLHSFFAEYEKHFSVKVLNDRTVFRMFKSQDQKDQWLLKSTAENASEFISNEIINQIPGVKGEYGFGIVNRSGNVNIQNLIQSFRKYLKSNDLVYEETFDFNKMKIAKHVIQYKDIEAGKVVFCGGIEDGKNPYFTNLPFKRTKGEVLIIEVKGFNFSGIIHNNINIVPLGGNKYWVGSTFNWQDQSLQTSDEARNTLKDQLERTLDLPFTILDQWAGIRPTVKDRRPMIGRHAEHQNLILFNGLGTRGVMLAPYMAMELGEHLEKGKELDKEVDIKRFTESE